MGVGIVDQPNVLFLTTKGKAVIVASKEIPTLTGAGKGVKLVNVKNGEVMLFKSVRKNEQVTVIDEGQGKGDRPQGVRDHDQGLRGLEGGAVRVRKPGSGEQSYD